ncbi:hypothetical protein [Mesobacterium pallidum]|uniref:hypothetical protein n=1 Tax=Mesobacterium pallidum TaxID=2872037 RepID=UPI001EE32372|nr:hypothetical protein [Mesobacterium pallidum]
MTLDPLDPHDPSSQCVLARARALNGEFDVAKSHFQQGFLLNPTPLHLRVSPALGVAFRGNLDRACALAEDLGDRAAGRDGLPVEKRPAQGNRGIATSAPP